MAELDRPALTPAWLRRSALGLWALSALAFLLVTLYYITCHHVSPLSRDQWHMYDALLARGLLDTSLGTMSGHRHLLAFLFYYIDLHYFAGLNHFLIALDWLLNGTLVALLCTQAWQLPASRLARSLLCGWIVILFCWLLNIALIGWGFNGINNFMSIVPGLLAIYCFHLGLHRHRPAWCVVSWLLGWLATLSFANGILVWPTLLFCLWIWRAPRCLFHFTLVAAALAGAAYALLPGASEAGAALKWPGTSFLTFPVQVMGGPLYHLLRSWHVITNESWLTAIASTAGVLITVVALQQFIRLLWQRPPLHAFQSLCVAMLCFGAGSCLMLSLSRLDAYLDFTTDRFQIFALLVWTGTAGLCFSTGSPATVRRWEQLFVLFPLLAFPAQLDWGARLAEYRSRVDMSLLPYQLYLPVQADAERALHWNWQNKLPHFFSVLEYLRAEQKNIFHDGLATHIGQAFVTPTSLPACTLQEEMAWDISTDDLLDVTPWPAAAQYQVKRPATCVTIARRWRWRVDTPAWDGGLLLDANGIVRGLVQPVPHSRLPRANGLRHTSFNAHGVMRLDAAAPGAITLVLLQQSQPVCQARLPD